MTAAWARTKIPSARCACAPRGPTLPTAGAAAACEHARTGVGQRHRDVQHRHIEKGHCLLMDCPRTVKKKHASFCIVSGRPKKACSMRGEARSGQCSDVTAPHAPISSPAECVFRRHCRLSMRSICRAAQSSARTRLPPRTAGQQLGTKISGTFRCLPGARAPGQPDRQLF
jgi:hypothetical protein